MQRCSDCKFGVPYKYGKNICVNRYSLNYGKIINSDKEACNDFSEGKSSTTLHPEYLWCETCKRTIYPDIEFKEHIEHDLYIDREIEDIIEYANIILAAGD